MVASVWITYNFKDGTSLSIMKVFGAWRFIVSILKSEDSYFHNGKNKNRIRITNDKTSVIIRFRYANNKAIAFQFYKGR